MTSEEYDRIYTKIYQGLKASGIITTWGERDFLDQYADGYMDGVEAALQEVVINEGGSNGRDNHRK